MATRRGASSLAVLCVSLGAVVHADEKPWVEVRSPRFVVVAQSGEGAARDLAWQFEQIHAVFTKAYPWAKLEAGRPFVVLGARNESSLRALSPAFWERWRMQPGSARVSGRGRDFVALRTDVGGSESAHENPYRPAYSGYVTVVVNASFPGRQPLWFDRGLQDFFGNTLVRQKDVHVGRLIDRHLELLNRGSRFPLAELLAIDSDSPAFRKEADRDVFEAQAWLFVHYLFFGENGANLPKLNRYADLLRAGRPALDAFGEAFGNLKPLEDGLGAYLTRKLYRYTQINLDVNIDRAAFPSRPVPPAELLALKAAYALALREPVTLTRGLAEAALQADPKQPGAHEVLGELADQEDRDDDARTELGLAVDNGSQSFFAHYQLARLLWKPDNDAATRKRIASLLEASARLNPDDRWSWDDLADARIELDDEPGALEAAKKAVQLAPGEARFRRTLARVYGNLKQFDAAQSSGGQALALSKTDDEKRQSRELLAWLARSRQYEADQAAPASASSAGPVAEAAPSAPSDSRSSDAEDDGGRTVRIDKHPCELADPAVCRAWLGDAEAACTGGSLEACSSAGWAYSAAPGVARDPAKAGRMLEQACAGGHADGCVNLAVNLVNRGRAEDRQRAVELLDKHCAVGNASACSVRKAIGPAKR